MNKELYNQMLEIAKSRRTAKQYNPEKNVDKETMELIYQFAKTAPHSMGLELVRIISVDRDSDHKKGINDHLGGYNQERAYMGSNLAILVTKKESFFTEDKELLIQRAKRMTKAGSEARGEEYIEGSEQQYIKAVLEGDHANNNFNREEWSARQAYIHLGYILMAAKTLGVDTTTMEGFAPTLTEYLLENNLINKDERATLVVTFGYTDPENKGTFIGKKQLRISDDEYINFK